MLQIHIFNVGQGDSVLIQFPNGSWGVVDCKADDHSSRPSALQYLIAHGVPKLAFVCLTHPHADHFSGLPSILNHYGPNIDSIWSFRLDSHHLKRFFATKKNAATTTSRRRDLDGLVEVYKHIVTAMRQNRLLPLDANSRSIAIGDVEVDCLAPHPKEIGAYQSSLARSEKNPEVYKGDENRLSVVLRLKYGQGSVILGSDATTSSWIDIMRVSERRKDSLASGLVKVSHHGSRDGFFGGAWKKITASAQTTHGAISAGNQYSHPHREVIGELRDLNVRLHCTNYAASCVKSERVDLTKFEGLPESTKLQLLMLDQTSNTPQIPCDGDLHFSLDTNGGITYKHQLAGLCPFHLPVL
jgi:beta-lactamase superfamily II metal-dependent hydrolase